MNNSIDVPFLIGVTLICLAIIFICIILYFDYLNTSVANDWEKVIGKVLKMEIINERQTMYTSIDEIESHQTNKNRVKILYEYTFKSKTYHGTSIYPSKINDFFQTDRSNKKIQNMIKSNSKIYIFVNPKKPTKASVLNRIELWDKIIAATVFFLLGLITLLIF